MAKRIKWPLQAEEELADILIYWVNRNQSATFSLKLIDLLKKLQN